MKKFLAFSLLIAFVVFTSFAATQTLTILHVNDTHGHAWAFSPSGNKDIGGFAALSTIVDTVKAEVEAQGGHVLVLHAGDYDTGVPESDMLDAAPDIVAMNMVGFDAVTLGNHEFDKSREVLMAQLGLLEFPMVNANVCKDGNPLVTPYIIKDFGDLKVAIFGLLTEETQILEPIFLQDLQFKNAEITAQELVPELREQADVVVALTHLGYYTYDPGEGITTSNKLAENVEGIDVIVDGHTHTLFETAPVINNTIIVQAGEWLKYVGRLDMVFEDGVLISQKWSVIPVNFKKQVTDANGKTVFVPDGEQFVPDRKVQAGMNYFYGLGAKELSKVIGITEVLLDGERSNVRSKDTNLTNLISDAMRWKAGADIAVHNGGGVRASIKAGPIAYRDVLTVQPFGNTLFVLTLKGSEVMELLKFAVTVPAGNGAMMHASGMTFVYENGEIKDVMVDGQPMLMDKVYKLVTNNYMAGGGDGYTVLKNNSSKGYDTGDRKSVV